MKQEIIQFFKESYFVLAYGFALVVAIITYRKYFDTVLKYFPILIAYTFFNELLGYFLRYYPNFSLFTDFIKNSQNDIIYNIYYVIYYGFFYFVYWKLNSNTKFKKWIRIGALITMFSYMVSAFFQNPLEINLYYASAIGSWILVFCIILYIYDKYLKGEKIVQSNNLMFWISLGLLIFYIIFPILLLIGYLDIELWEEYHLRTVLRILIVIMYSIFTIGFLKGSKKAFK